MEKIELERRELNFECLDSAVAEAESLLKQGYTRSGNWSLGQVCCHMRLTIEANMRGYPRWMVVLGYPLRPFLRRFLLPRLLNGRSPSGLPTAGKFVPGGDVDDAKEVERFKQCVATFQDATERLHAHPAFGSMSYDEFEKFHAARAAHHLSFLHPRNTGG